jgi:putative transposase
VDIRAYEATVLRRLRPKEMSTADWALRRWKLVFGRTEQWLDRQPAVRHLADAQLAGIVANALLFFAGRRYELFAFVVMPSHFHWVFRPLETWVRHLPQDPKGRQPRERIMHSVKRYTARECNKLLGTKGRFWQQESYDHWARDVDELERITHYVEYNPVKAGLATEPRLWPFGSAKHRENTGQVFGAPLVKAE